MKRALPFLALSAAIVAGLLAGCSKDNPDNNTPDNRVTPTDSTVVTVAGSVRLTVSVSGTGYTAKSSEEDADISSFILTFTGVDDPSYVREYTVAEFTDAYPDGVMELEAGAYSVAFISPETEDAAWSQPIWGDSAVFSVEAGATTNVNLVGTIQNVKVTVSVTDEFKEAVSSYSIVVAGNYGGQDKSLTWTEEIIEAGTAGYFGVSNLTVTTSGTKQDGSEYTDVQTISDVSAADWYDIVIEAPYVEPDTTPTIVWSSNPDFESVTLTGDLDIDLVVTAPEGIETFKVKIETTSFILKLALTLIGLSTDLDLINDETVVSLLSGYSITCGENLYHQTNVVFSLTSLASLLTSVNLSSGTTVNFVITVTDQKNQSVEKTIYLVMP